MTRSGFLLPAVALTVFSLKAMVRGANPSETGTVTTVAGVGMMVSEADRLSDFHARALLSESSLGHSRAFLARDPDGHAIELVARQ
jgi:hypothetical protein